MTVTNLDRHSLGANQQIYQRLKAALELNLRRQIFVAVCDDLALRNLIAARLHTELAYPTNGATSPNAGRYPQLVSLNLDLNDPDPVAQCAHWLRHHPPPKQTGQLRLPAFQILGVERLTRQMPTVQRLFLSNLQRIEQTLPTLEASLVLWMPRPWCRMIQQSAPEFWRWHTGVFEFVGDPTPVPASVKQGEPPSAKAPIAPPNVPRKSGTPPGSQAGIGDRSHPPRPVATPGSGTTTGGTVPSNNGTKPAAPTAKTNPPGELPASGENVWEILTEDLSKLDQGEGAIAAQTTAQKRQSAVQSQSPGALAQKPQAPKPPSDRQPPGSPKSVPARPDAPPAAKPGAKSATPIAGQEQPAASVPLTQSQSALELADFVLASIAQEMGEQAKQSAIAPVTPPAPSQTAKLQPIQVLEHIEQLHLQQAPAAALATAYRTLGNLYRDRIEQGQSSQQNLLISIRAYEQAISWLDESSSLWSDILNDIGNLYWMLSHNPGSSEQALTYLEQGIQAYQKALSKTNPATRPHSYSMIQNNLGSAFGDRARYRDPVENLQASIAAYEEALRYRDANADPQRFAAAKNNLGTAYWNLAQHEKPIVNLSQAIVAYNEALKFYNPEQEPLSFAMIQNNIGTAYWNLAQFDQNALDQSLGTSLGASPEDLLQLAIGAYRVALVFRTQDTVPAAYAATQNNLGTAYWHLANQPTIHYDDRREYLQQAIVVYKAALDIAHQLITQSIPLSFDFFATHNNLGLALYQLATDKHCDWDKDTQLAYLEQALQHHLQALQGWEAKPDFYQTAFGYVVQTIRTCYSDHGINGQNLALSKVPGQLLPEILKRL